jgi:dihydroneopterin aldolase/2-amino-4-hydroxy-6-hydroxymethyldihydropteridine diphosphokinase
VRGAQDRLLERLAERVAESVLAMPRVEAVEVTVAKLRPPVPEQLHSTAVHILRHRRDYPVQAPPKSLSS